MSELTRLLPGAVKVIKGVKFGVLSPDEIRKMSVVEVQMPDTYDESGEPIPGGLMDGRLGTLEPGQRCRTCGNRDPFCPGHFGHIELAVPVIHVEFVKIIHDLLRATCRYCGRLRIPDGICPLCGGILRFNREVGTYTCQKCSTSFTPEELAKAKKNMTEEAQKAYATTMTIEKLKKRMERLEAMLGKVPESFYKFVLKEAMKHKECPHCGTPNYKIELIKPTTFHEHTETGVQHLTPSAVRERLERIPDEDLILLGIDPKSARPEWMVLTVLPVPPVYVRPAITLETGIRSEDDLTHKLVDILRINQRLKEDLESGAPPLIIQDLSELLAYHVNTYFDNEISGVPSAKHRSGRVLKALAQRLKGKVGRFRGHLTGKRVDFSARTVISPDPNIDINEVGVPVEIAMKLRVPERVTPWNLEKMRELVRNGPDRYPGAVYVITPDGRKLRLEFVKDLDELAEQIGPGWVVERHLMDGDIVLFNRQPSLHRMSIMAHRVRVLPYKTFRLHLCACPPYNADFDGDEMNLHVPQSEEARAEARLLLQVQDHILSPRFGGPIIGAIRDFLSMAYLLTRKSTYLTKDEVCRLLAAAGYEGPLPEPDVKEPVELWSGKKIFSIFLPKDFNYTFKAKTCRSCSVCLKEKCPYDAYVVIKDGQLICGTIDKNAIGAEQTEGLLHRLVKDYGTEFARDFLNRLCRLLNVFGTMKGFTYGYDELKLPDEVVEKIREVLRNAEEKVNELIEQYRAGTLKPLPGMTLEESLENYIMDVLSKAREEAGKIADEYFIMDNAGTIMTRTGARGSKLNIGQMSANVGQQSVRGRRITRGYTNRTLPHFKPGDVSPKARGFVYSCFRDGLDPIEFFFHAMGGRDGLVDTAVRTQQSGYMQRRLIHALEHLKVEYDGTVRTPTGCIVQFRYGEDGVDPAKSDHGKAVNVVRLVEQVKLAVGPGEPAPEDYIEERLAQVEHELTKAIRDELREELRKARLSKEGVDRAIELAVIRYKRALVEPGEAVGVVTAQSIGEPGTQMTLRTFHYAGVREQNVTLGLPRLIEIVDARRQPSTPIMEIRLDEEHRKSEEKAREVAKRIIHTTVESVTKDIYRDILRECVVLDLDEDMMADRDVTVDEVVRAIETSLKCTVDVEGLRLYVRPKSGEAKALRRLIEKLPSVHIKGVPGIKRVIVDKDSMTGEWFIRADGSNLRGVIDVEGVDPTRTYTNDIHEVASVLGIEAARNAIIREAKGVLDEQGLDVDIRHIMLVADTMTNTGVVRQIGRHGVAGEKASVLARAAFETPIVNLVKAAVRGEVDELRGVTENILIGQPIPVGTGAVTLFMSLMPKEAGS
ncbi:DNA-directed RNA polymerase subunit A'/A'' [Candidatus Bathyarchaeota archaeon ex4484_135]|nr:MAG: DNA-directed RNA polymerase subunit A'/A'' [Candidatus Bathyarchaeota archaeon ex4484_135]